MAQYKVVNQRHTLQRFSEWDKLEWSKKFCNLATDWASIFTKNTLLTSCLSKEFHTKVITTLAAPTVKVKPTFHTSHYSTTKRSSRFLPVTHHSTLSTHISYNFFLSIYKLRTSAFSKMCRLTAHENF